MIQYEMKHDMYVIPEFQLHDRTKSDQKRKNLSNRPGV